MHKIVNYNFFKTLVMPRPTGSKNNNAIIQKIKEIADQMRYETEQLPFNCLVWEKADSFLEHDGQKTSVNPSPFSPSVESVSELCFIHTINDLREKNIHNKIVILVSEIAKEPISPKDFPYYYPDAHKEINDLLEKNKPAAIIAVTGKHPVCGLNPFPLFEDGNFSIPSAYISEEDAGILMRLERAAVRINSTVTNSKSSQLIIRKPAKIKTSDTIIVCAHMDTAYDTPGALDNAVGLTAMLQIMEGLKDSAFNYNFEFVPFNGEDYFDIPGQRIYLEKCPLEGRSIKLVLNIDGAGHVGSKNAISAYGIDDSTAAVIQNIITKDGKTVPGQQWYEGDHSMFVQNNIPAIAFTSSDLLEEVVDITHTPNDTLDVVDCELIKTLSNFAVQLFQHLGFVQ